MRLLKRIFRGGAVPSAPARFDAPMAPAARLAVVGDIHGCADLLENLLAQLETAAPERLVFVGDYIDRGEDSARVLERLHTLARAEGSRAVFLKFGIGGFGARPDEARAVQARDALARALGPEMLAWLRALPTSFISGNIAVVHAAANPGKPIAAQSEQALLWGHPAFATTPRTDGVWVVHGHTIVDAVQPEAGRIGVDTGAYATGRLSAALLDGTDMKVLTAPD